MRSPIHNMKNESVVTNEGLRNDVLEKFLRQFGHRHFAGVFSVDLVPPQLINVHQGGKCFIVNLSPSHRSGGHFIAIYIKEKNLWYFDSYALPPPAHNHHLMNLLQRWKKRRKNVRIRRVLTYPVQNFNSLFCGWYTAAFCMMVTIYSSCDPRYFSNFFSRQNLNHNEKIVQYLIKSLCDKLKAVPK